MPELRIFENGEETAIKRSDEPLDQIIGKCFTGQGEIDCTLGKTEINKDHNFIEVKTEHYWRGIVTEYRLAIIYDSV